MKRTTVGILVLLLLAVATPAFAVTIIIGAPGDAGSGNCFPFGLLGCSPGSRYQQVYNAALFPGPLLINQLQFFNTNFNPGLGVVDTANYEIHLSATAVAVNALNTSDFDSNVGANDALFFNGVLGGPVGGTTFSISGTGFLYDPADGNLLLDIFKTGGVGGNVFFDARSGTFGTDSSRAHNFGSAFVSYGLVTGFSDDGLTPVPEPATLALLAPALAWAAWRRHRRT
jgi:hypothetical protein